MYLSVLNYAYYRNKVVELSSRWDRLDNLCLYFHAAKIKIEWGTFLGSFREYYNTNAYQKENDGSRIKLRA